MHVLHVKALPYGSSQGPHLGSWMWWRNFWSLAGMCTWLHLGVCVAPCTPHTKNPDTHTTRHGRTHIHMHTSIYTHTCTCMHRERERERERASACNHTHTCTHAHTHMCVHRTHDLNTTTLKFPCVNHFGHQLTNFGGWSLIMVAAKPTLFLGKQRGPP